MNEKKDIKAVNVQSSDDTILEVSHLKKYFPIKGGMFGKQVGSVKAVDDVSFTLKRGTTMGLVGESGCGKSTTGRTILRLIDKTEGTVKFDGKDVFSLSRKEMQDMRTKMQIIFQDPYSSLSPRLPVGEIIGEAVREHHLVPKDEYQDYVTKIMNDCGLQAYHKDRYPHEFSGGQRQRISIARAILKNPKILVLDEATSALDTESEKVVQDALDKLMVGRTAFVIAHRLSTIKNADHILVLNGGRISEQGTHDELMALHGLYYELYTMSAKQPEGE